MERVSGVVQVTSTSVSVSYINPERVKAMHSSSDTRACSTRPSLAVLACRLCDYNVTQMFLDLLRPSLEDLFNLCYGR
jgi:hypothetical protein